MPVAPSLSLATLKVANLRNIAVSLGLNNSGTKALLSSRILSSLQDEPSATGSHRILSIDMGVRNLAFCVLTYRPGGNRRKPKLLAWQRLSLFSSPDHEDFSPPLYATSANRLARRLVSDYGDVHTVLIERQRWRSGGGAAVLEWTLRVNTLEAMLHAVFECLKESGVWAGRVESVSPRKVSSYWVTNTGQRTPDGRKGGTPMKLGSHALKTAKVAIVKDWLRENTAVERVGGDVEGVTKLFVETRRRQRKDTKRISTVAEDEEAAKVSEEPHDKRSRKLDDLADCLLQGVAWIRWNQNRYKMMRGGVPDGISLEA